MSYYFMFSSAGTGTRGPTGPSGNQGPQGSSGLQGPTGLPGITGLQGPQGIQGASGIQGTSGIQGPSGLQGASGLAGVTGLQGTTGLQGPQGPAGPQGLAGSGSVTAFTGLTDISFSTFGPGQSLFYNGTNNFVMSRNFGNIANVLDLGASGDGTSDDRIAIQNAVNRVNNSGYSVLYFPSTPNRVSNYIINVAAIPSAFNPTGNNNSYPFIYITKPNIKILMDPDVVLTVKTTIRLEGDGPNLVKAPLFGIYAGGCTIEGGTYTFSGGNNVSGYCINTGNFYNGYPIFYNTAYNTTWKNVTFSGFAGTSVNSGLATLIPEEYSEKSTFINCTFLNWGGAWNDRLIEHQGDTLFDTCKFIHRENTGVPGSIKEHSSALVVRNLVSNVKYYNCLFKNIGGGFGNQAYEIDILSTGVQQSTFMCRAINIDKCTFVNSKREMPILGKIIHPIINNNRFIYEFTGTATQSTFLSNTLPGWLLSGAMYFNINGQNNLSISLYDSDYGVVANNRDCYILLNSCSGIAVNKNFFESDSDRVNNNRPILGRARIFTTDICQSMISTNFFTYDSNTGILVTSATNTGSVFYQGLVQSPNMITYNIFNSVGNFPTGFPILLSGSTRNTVSNNTFIQTGLISNHSIVLKSIGTFPGFSYTGNYVHLFKGNLFHAYNVTGGLGPYLIDVNSTANTISQNVELGNLPRSIIQNGARNKSRFNLYSSGMNAGTGTFSMDSYNVTGKP